ncbi:hypothetical protein L4C39_19130 [Vibrio clamense]|uniref:hypothetical protein n=1 Tax=Vibrio clamense TaxID=2910254 RepID=UPI003D24E9C4
MKNIELFNLGVASILGRCYESFPVPIEVSSGSIATEVERKITGHPWALVDSYSEEQKIADSTISWLIDSGYIKGERKERIDAYDNVVLTPMGLIALNSMPESLKEPSITIGDKLINFSGDCAISVLSDLAKVAIGEGAKLLMG